MKLFESSYNDEPVERLPTLLQYIKTQKGKKRPKAFHVALIWLPNKFPSYAIETDKFRFSVAASSLMGQTLAVELQEILILERSVHLSITDDENGSRVYGFQPGTTSGSWEEIGSEKTVGIKFVAD